jgi:hypothetical protein
MSQIYSMDNFLARALILLTDWGYRLLGEDFQFFSTVLQSKISITASKSLDTALKTLIHLPRLSNACKGLQKALIIEHILA